MFTVKYCFDVIADFSHISLYFSSNSSPFMKKYVYLIYSKSLLCALISESNKQKLCVVLITRTRFRLYLCSIVD